MELENIISNPWDNVYWFARMLINSDKYGSIGSDSSLMRDISRTVQTILTAREFENEEEDFKINLLTRSIENILLKGRSAKTAKYNAIKLLYNDILKELETINDFEVLALTCEKIMIPINRLLKEIPSNDSIFVESIAKALLDEKGVQGLSNIINILDELGSKGCISKERELIVNAFGLLKEEIKNLSEKEMDIVLTAFCQEFERRVGQKRKGRAGRGVEGTTSLILNYFGIKATHAPEHFTSGLEVDKWIRTKDGWILGISCKRTLRERWKQAYTTDIDLLNRHKILELWHVITFDKDLSDDKITEIGSHRAILYLPDESPRLKYSLSHPGMKDYVRPLSKFIPDLRSRI